MLTLGALTFAWLIAFSCFLLALELGERIDYDD